MPIKHIKNSYNAGELSEYMAGRTDVSKYHNGCSKLINATVLPHGGVVKRSGTEFIGQAPNKCKHFGFEFSVSDTMVLEFSNYALRFYKDGARIYEDDIAARNVASTTAADPVQVTTDGNHLYSTGDWVLLEDIDTATALNDKHYVIVLDSVSPATKFDLYWPRYDGRDSTSTAANTLTDTTQSWATNELATLTLINATDGTSDTIASNTATVVTMDNPGTVTFDEDDHYVIGTSVDGTGYGVGGAAGNSKKVYEITTVYSSAEAFELHTTQSADVMYIAHEDHPPQKLSRNGDNDWTIADVVFDGGPFLDENTDADLTMKITGSTLTSTDANPDRSFNDTTQSWETDELAGYTFYNITNNENKEILSNTATRVTLTGDTTTDNEITDEYVIVKNGYYIPAGMKNLTLTATGHTPFLGTTNDVGTKWQLTHTRADNIQSTQDNSGNTAPTDLTNAIRIQGDLSFRCEPAGKIKLWRKAGNGEWQEVRSFKANTAYSATEEEEDVYYAWTRSSTGNADLTAEDQIWNGVATVTAAVDTSNATVTATTDLYWVGANATNESETSLWSEGAWGLFRGYPRTVSFFEDRLWWASSTNSPDTLWGSKSSQYEDMRFTNLGLDDDAMVVPFQDNEVSQIQWMQARHVMAVGAANKEYRFGASDPDKPATPSDRKSTPQTSFGSDKIQPIILNNAIFFMQRQGRKLRAMQFDNVSENFKADDATLLANTILESRPICMAAQRVPDSIIWVVRTDGILATFTYEPEEEVSGWARHFTQNTVSTEQPGGYFESVAVIHGDTEDEVWVSVRRLIDSDAGGTPYTYRYTERFTTRLFGELDEATMLDSAKIVSSDFEAQDIVYASDTVRYGVGFYGSSLYGV